MGPTLAHERFFRSEGHRLVAGLDEVGRGCLAGPVMAGAVMLPIGDPAICAALRVGGLRDSKKLSALRREALVPLIEEVALGVAVGEASPEEIDIHGIVAACVLAMQRALAALPAPPTALLVDGRAGLPYESRPQRAVPGGDDRSLSIAAASVVAKVARDAQMQHWAQLYPGYGLEANKGYGTAQHLAALRDQGATPIHRLSWKPLRALHVSQLPLRGLPFHEGT